MKKVLIVSPRFPPSSAPDYHRVRVMLPFLGRHGWKPVVLCVDSESVQGPVDADLLTTIPESTEVVPVRAIPLNLSRLAGFGGLWARARPFLKAAGDRLLRNDRFDLVFFSTTEFPVLPLGPRWRKKFGVPFVVDFQDPWVNPYYAETGARPPGGFLKHSIHQAYARRHERKVLGAASHIVAVSPAYPKALNERYPSLPASLFSVVPFGASESDFDVARNVEQSVFNPRDGCAHWVYAGVVNPGMSPSIASFLAALRRAWSAGIVTPDTLRIHFVGTDYAHGGASGERVGPMARLEGVDSFIEERTTRAPYLEVLRCLADADALLMFGTDEPGYSASKLFPYVLARKPLLAIFHAHSSLISTLAELSCGVAVSFPDELDQVALADSIFRAWFENRDFAAAPRTDWSSFERYSAESMTARLADIFDRAAAPRPKEI